VAEVKRSFTWLGRQVEVVEVPILKRIEDVHEYHLEDGAIIRVATPTMAVLRVDESKDAMGNPTYLVQSGTSVTVIQGPKPKD
jgi:hypothetical protein